MKVVTQICQHVYISFKLKQDPITMRLIEFFYDMILKMPILKLENVDPHGIVQSLDIKLFNPEMLINQIKSSTPDILRIQLVFFWMKTSILIKFQEESKLLEHFCSFTQNFFRPVSFGNMDVISTKMLCTIWKINFINENYKFIESKVRVDKEKNQHWMVIILSLLQKNYHYLSKAYQDYQDDYSDLFDRFDRFLSLEQEGGGTKTIWIPRIEHKREYFDIKEVFPHKKDHITKAIVTVTTNLLNNAYFVSHPRRFVVEYINSLQILLSLKSKRLFEFAGEQIKRNLPQLGLCQQFSDIFRVIVLHRATYQARKKDFESAILNLMDFLSAQNGMQEEDYKKAVEVHIF